MSRPRCCSAWPGMLLLAAAAGCLWPGNRFEPTGPDVAQRRAEERAVSLARYEQAQNTAQLAAAEAARRRGDLAAARASLAQLLARQPRHLAGLLLLSEVCLADHAADEAVDAARRAVAAAGTSAEAAHVLGLALEAAGDEAAARAEFARALALAPGDAVYRASLAACSGAGEVVVHP